MYCRCCGKKLENENNEFCEMCLDKQKNNEANNGEKSLSSDKLTQEVQTQNLELSPDNIEKKNILKYVLDKIKKNKKWSIVIGSIILLLILINSFLIYIRSSEFEIPNYKYVSFPKYLTSSRANLKKISNNEYTVLMNENVFNSTIKDYMKREKSALPKDLDIKGIYADVKNQKLYMNVKKGIIKLGVSCNYKISYENNKMKYTLDNFRMSKAEMKMPAFLINKLFADKTSYESEITSIPKFVNIEKLESNDDKVMFTLSLNYEAAKDLLNECKNNADTKVLKYFMQEKGIKEEVAEEFSKAITPTNEIIDKLVDKMYTSNDYTMAFMEALKSSYSSSLYSKYSFCFGDTVNIAAISSSRKSYISEKLKNENEKKRLEEEKAAIEEENMERDTAYNQSQAVLNRTVTVKQGSWCYVDASYSSDSVGSLINTGDYYVYETYIDYNYSVWCKIVVNNDGNYQYVWVSYDDIWL